MTELLPLSAQVPGAMHSQYPMAHDETQEINVSGRTILSAGESERQFGLAVPSVAEINAGKHRFTVLDTRQIDVISTPLLLVDISFYREQSQGYKGIREQEALVVGRGHHSTRFNYHPTVSKNHFSLAYDGLTLAVKNLRPTNKTLLTGDFIGTDSTSSALVDNIQTGFTRGAEKLKDSRDDIVEVDAHAPYGYYQSRPIIGRHSPSVKGGVYFTHNPNSEAVVVDSESAELQQTLQAFLRYIELLRQQPSQGVLEYLFAVNDFTRRVMPYKLGAAERLSRPHYDTNGLINLSEYIRNRAGVCRHQCLLAAYLTESLVEQGIIYGQARVERNHDIDAHGAHAWAMFKSASGKDIVVDPAQEFVGTKEQARKEKRWKYQVALER